jgi:hypothetical protein
MPLERLVREASRVAHATVVDVRAGHDEHGMPATWVTFHTLRSLKGPGGDSFTIKQFGVPAPLADGTATRLIGLPRYIVGDEVVILVREESQLGFTSPVGLAQGVFRVTAEHGAKRVRDDRTPGRSRSADDLLSDIQRLIARQP